MQIGDDPVGGSRPARVTAAVLVMRDRVGEHVAVVFLVRLVGKVGGVRRDGHHVAFRSGMEMMLAETGA